MKTENSKLAVDPPPAFGRGRGQSLSGGGIIFTTNRQNPPARSRRSIDWQDFGGVLAVAKVFDGKPFLTYFFSPF
jgi:hypothetical protein